MDKEGDIPDDQLDKQEEGRSDEKETSDDDMKVESEESSEADDSEIELSDQLTEVSDTGDQQLFIIIGITKSLKM